MFSMYSFCFKLIKIFVFFYRKRFFLIEINMICYIMISIITKIELINEDVHIKINLDNNIGNII